MFSDLPQSRAFLGYRTAPESDRRFLLVACILQDMCDLRTRFAGNQAARRYPGCRQPL
jgi:hypothetical protein